LAAAVEQGGEAMAAPHHQGTDPLGAVEFVGGEGEQGDAPGVELDGDFAHGLGGVAEKGDVVALGDNSDHSARYRNPLSFFNLLSKLMVSVHSLPQRWLIHILQGCWSNARPMEDAG
jgi:hypothetical protein